MKHFLEKIKKTMKDLKLWCKNLKEEHSSFRDPADKMIVEKDKEISRLIDMADDNDNYNTGTYKQDTSSISNSAAEQQILILARQQAQREEELAQSPRHILALQKEIEDLERENRLHSPRESMLKVELHNMERTQKREGVDMTYLKNVFLKLLETGMYKQDASSISNSAAEQQILILARQKAQREEELAQSQRHILALQEEIEELERENRLHSPRESMLKVELRNMERMQKREGVDMTYLKNVFLKLLETGMYKQDASSISNSAAEQQILILARQQAQREEELAQSPRHILALQKEIEDLERENRLHSQQESMLKAELHNMERTQKREGVDMTYLKNVILKLLETDAQVSTSVPSIRRCSS